MPKQPLKVFQNCCLFLKAGGIETLLKNWYGQTNPQQISMDFGANSSKDADKDFMSYVHKRGNAFIIGEGPCFLLQKLSYWTRLYKTLKKGKYDIFQFHGTSFLLLDNWIARLAGVKKRYYLVHGTVLKNPFLKRLVRWNLKYSGMRFLAVSTRAGKNFYGEKIPFTVVHPGIDSTAFAYNPDRRQKIRAQLGLESNFVIGHVGRLAPEKNHSFLLEIFHEIYKKNPSARLVLVGDGPEEKNIRQKASQLNLEKQILFVGTQQEVSLYYQAFDAFVLPSVSEGFPLSALEAQTAGLPCFLSDTITRQIQVCNTTFVSLRQSPAIWAKEILTKQEGFIRQDCSERVKQAGFDISGFFNKLEQLYLQD